MIYENRPYHLLEEGEEASLTRVCMEDDFYAFANVSGNHNPLHLADYDGDGDGAREMVAPGMYLASLISAVAGQYSSGRWNALPRADPQFHGSCTSA